MRIAYLECFAGISGDMFLGALLDAGVPFGVLEDVVRALNLDASIRVEKVDRSGISSTKVHVLENGALAESPGHSHAHPHTHEDGRTHTHEHAHTQEHAHEHTHVHSHSHVSDPAHTHDHSQPHGHGRSLSRIRELIAAMRLADPVKAFAIRTFELLGASEAKIHNVPVENIHFHEVGAVDAIVDIVAAAAAIDHLNRNGSVHWYCSAINVGGGMVECAHGTFPVPAPATADLLRGMPTYSAHVQKELVTPTGAALLLALAPRFSPHPPGRMESIGYGAGTRDPKGFPNVLRLSIGDSLEEHQQRSKFTGDARLAPTRKDTSVAVLETAIDDANPQLLAAVAEQALEAGALDVMLTPVIMKKGRPGTLFTLLARPEDSSRLEQLLLRETTTLGIRIHYEERSCLARRHITVTTSYGDIRIKTGSFEEKELNAAPEFEDCRAAARRHSVPLKEVIRAAVAAYSAGKSL